MLILTRRPFEAIYIGDDTRIRVVGREQDGAVRLRIEVPGGKPLGGVEPAYQVDLAEGRSPRDGGPVPQSRGAPMSRPNLRGYAVWRRPTRLVEDGHRRARSALIGHLEVTS